MAKDRNGKVLKRQFQMASRYFKRCLNPLVFRRCKFNLKWNISLLTSGTQIFKRALTQASLVAQWQRICLPMQETQIQSLIQKDPTGPCVTTPESVLKSLGTITPEPMGLSYWNLSAREPMLHKRRILRSPHTARKSSPCSPQLGKSRWSNEDQHKQNE